MDPGADLLAVIDAQPHAVLPLVKILAAWRSAVYSREPRLAPFSVKVRQVEMRRAISEGCPPLFFRLQLQTAAHLIAPWCFDRAFVAFSDSHKTPITSLPDRSIGVLDAIDQNFLMKSIVDERSSIDDIAGSHHAESFHFFLFVRLYLHAAQELMPRYVL